MCKLSGSNAWLALHAAVLLHTNTKSGVSGTVVASLRQLAGPSAFPTPPFPALQALRAAGGRGFSGTAGTGEDSGGGSARRARGARSGLLYALSGSLKPLCCWCVEGGGSASASTMTAAGGDGAEGEADDAAISRMIERALRTTPPSR